MADVTPPKPPTPKAAAKGLAGILKGKPAWMWVAGVTVLVGVAYVVWRNGQRTEETVADDGSSEYGPVAGEYGYGDEFVTPAATQGAFGGYDSPLDFEPLTQENAGEPEASPLVVVNVPGPYNGGGEEIPGIISAAGPGGGNAPRSATSHQSPPPKVNTTQNARAGRRYIEKTDDGWIQHWYESAPGKGDYGKKAGTKIKVRRVAGGGGSAPAPGSGGGSGGGGGGGGQRLWGGHPLSWWQNPANAKRNGKWKWPGGGGYIHSRHFNGN